MNLARCFALIVLLIGFAAQVPSGAQQLYRWVDENGGVQYSDRPPPPGAGSRPQQIKKKPRTPPPAASENQQAPRTYVEQDAEFRKRQVEKAEKEAKEQQERQAAADRKRRCDEARNQLAGLQAGGRVMKYNAAGEREFLDDKGRAEEVARTQKAVADLCK
ncbi:MAG: DUF4124 domain-containing protein [Burkholderiales bacterium]